MRAVIKIIYCFIFKMLILLICSWCMFIQYDYHFKLSILCWIKMSNENKFWLITILFFYFSAHLKVNINPWVKIPTNILNTIYFNNLTSMCNITVQSMEYSSNNYKPYTIGIPILFSIVPTVLFPMDLVK